MWRITGVWLLRAVAILFFLLITIVLVIRQIDLNTYKSSLVASIKSKTGLEASFEGDIQWSFLPGIGIQTGKVVLISNRNLTEQPLIEIAQSEIRIELLPLLQHKLEVSALTLEGLTLDLINDAHGRGNWPDSFSSLRSTIPYAATVPARDNIMLPAFAIHSVTVNNARVTWDNRQRGKRLEFNNINARLKGYPIGKPAQITLSTAINGNTFEFPGSLTLNTGLLLDENLNRIALTQTEASWNGFNRHANSQPLTCKLTIPAGQYEINRQALRLTGLRFETNGFRLKAAINGRVATTRPDIQADVDIAPFNPALTMQQWHLNLPVVRNNKAFTKLAMKFRLQATPDSISVTDLDMTLDDSRINGAATVEGFKHPKLNFDLVVDAINLDLYREPRKKLIPSQRNNGEVINVNSVTQILERLKRLNTNGIILFRRLVFDRITMQNLRWSFVSKQDLVKTVHPYDLNKP